MRETRVKSLGWEDPLEKKMATHSSTLAWKIPWMEKPGRLQSVGSQRVGHDWVTSLSLSLENSALATGLEKVSFRPNPKERKAMPKNAQTTTQLHLSHTLVKERSKFSKPGFSNKWTVNFQMFKLVLEKAEEPEIKLATSTGSWKKPESSRKTPISALLTMPKPLTVWITINCGKFWKKWEYQTTWPASWEICMQVRKELLELDMERLTGSK